MKKLTTLLNLLITSSLTGCLGFAIAQVYVDVQQSAVTWCEASPDKCAEIEIRQIGVISTVQIVD